MGRFLLAFIATHLLGLSALFLLGGFCGLPR